MTTYDDLVLGAGMAGLTTAAMLVASGRRVLLVEAHDVPGGYAHTFRMGAYGFCAQVHYVFHCGEGEPIHQLLTRIGKADAVPFERLDPEGFDHVVVAGERHRIPNGHAKHRDRLIRRFPEHEAPLRAYFDVLVALERELDVFPGTLRLRDVVTAPLRFPHLLRYRKATLQDLFDRVGMPLRLQAFLAGQAGDYLLPPREVSLLLHVALVRGYDRGAYYPRHHFSHFIETIAGYVARAPGSRLLLGTEIARIHTDGARVVGVTTRGGERLEASRYVCNIDPQHALRLFAAPPRDDAFAGRLRYAYSSGTITVYLGVRGLDLRDHGFGNFNVWHYPHADLNELYRRQAENDLRDPWLFLSTPTLHSPEPGLCPEGDQILELATSAPFAAWQRLRDGDRKRYNAEKKKVRDRMIAIVEERYAPGLSKHLVMRVTGTPATNARFCRAPEGNAYGAALTPDQVGPTRVPFETPYRNFFFVNATAGYPSIGGAVSAGLELSRRLLG